MEFEALAFVRFCQFTIIIPTGLAFYRWKDLNKTQVFLALVVLVTLATEVTSTTIVALVENPNNLPLYHIFVVMVFILSNRLYRIALANFLNKWMFDLLLVLFCLFALINSVFIESIWTFNSNAVFAAGTIYIFYSLLYFYTLLQSGGQGVNEDPVFWLSIGLILYYSGSLSLFIVINYLTQNPNESVTNAWLLNSVFNLVLNFFYTVALWKKSKI